MYAVKNCEERLRQIMKNVSPTNIQHNWIKTDQLDVTRFIISLFNAQHVSNVSTSILSSLRFICGVISWVVLIWFDVCWCYGVVRLGWCGILMQAEALLQHYLMLNMFRILVHPSSGVCDLFFELFHGLYSSGSICVGVTVLPHCSTNTHRTRAIQHMK